MSINSYPVGTKEAAQILGWSPDTLRYWADVGILPEGAVELTPGGHRRFHVEIIQKWAQLRAQFLTNSEIKNKLRRASNPSLSSTTPSHPERRTTS